MLWAMLFGGMFLLLFAGLVFVISRVRRFGFVKKLAHERKAASWGVGAAVVLGAFALLWAAWGLMNAIIVLLHLAVFWGVAESVQYAVTKRGRRPARLDYASAAAVIVTVLYLGVGWIQAKGVWQTNYAVDTQKEVGTLRVALLADAHVGTTFDGKGLKTHIARIQQQNPDVVLIAGDFVDEGTDRANMQAACRALSGLKPRYGVYFVFGNHDKGLYANGRRGYNGDELIAEMEKNGVRVLQDETVLIDNRFYLIGRKDASEEMDFGGSRETMETLTAGLDKEKFSIVLDHQPRDYAAEAAAGADLVLSGHTHGGQMIPLMQCMRWFRIGGNDSVYGKQRRENTEFIVTSVISDWAIRFKTGCFSEFVMIEIEQTKQQNENG